MSAKLLVSQLIVSLGADWSLIPNEFDNENYQAFMNNKNGVQFYGSTQKREGTLQLGVCLPKSWYRNGSWPVVRVGNVEIQRPFIKMSADKDPAKMAKDFHTRLEVAGTEFYEMAEAALVAASDAAATRINNRKELAKVVGADWTHYFAEHPITSTVNKVHVSADIPVANNVALTLSYMTMDQARKVLAILND